MNIEALEYGIVRYGTPLYVFDLDELQDNVQRFRSGLKGRAGLCFAMKANPFLVRPMSALVDRIEVCSMGEYQICRALQIPPEKILVSGVMEKKADLLQILEDCRGRCCYTVESLTQFGCLASWCDAHEEEIRVYLRLTSGNQFGMDKEALQNIMELKAMYPFLKIQGLHYFSGTQKKNVDKIRKELAFLDEFCQELGEKMGLPLEELEYGPGIPVAYFAGQENTLERDIDAIADAIAAMQWKGSVMLEMGRALAASCGYYLTGVQDTKQNDGNNYCIVDGGIHQLNYDGQIRGMQQPLFQISPAHESEPAREWTVCGALCTANDVLMQKVKIKDLRIGSVLIFERAGAYSMTEGMALFLSHPLPRAALYSKGDGWRLVRQDRPTYMDNMENVTVQSHADLQQKQRRMPAF